MDHIGPAAVLTWILILFIGKRWTDAVNRRDRLRGTQEKEDGAGRRESEWYPLPGEWRMYPADTLTPILKSRGRPQSKLSLNKNGPPSGPNCSSGFLGVWREH